MALLWMDGFDHYGDGATGRANMLDGVYASIGSSMVPSTLNPRTGNYSLRQSNHASFRRVFGANKTTVCVGFALYMNSLPSNNGGTGLLFQNNAAVAQVSFNITTAGEIICANGTYGGTTLGTSAQVITAGAYQHLEFKVTIHDTTGAVEVRRNGVTILNLTNVDTSAGSSTVAQVEWNTSSFGYPFYIDDLYAWDTSGTSANDFLGDRRVITLFPNGDTAQSDWTRNSTALSNDYEAIDESSSAGPDDDTSYIYTTSSTAGHASDFDFENLPANVSSITAVQTVGYMRKTDAGSCDVKMSMLSSTDVSSGSTHNLTEVYTYYQDVFHTDPATGAAWTSSAVDAAKIRFIRTL